MQPTPIYETLSMGLLAFVLWNLRDAFRPGVLFGFYLVGAGVERFLVEFARRNESVVGFMTAAQVESRIMFLLGIAWLLIMRARNGGQLTAPQTPAPLPKDAKRRRPATA